MLNANSNTILNINLWEATTYPEAPIPLPPDPLPEPPPTNPLPPDPVPPTKISEHYAIP